jgi:outer membrane receptor protein involved in Fe transport
LNNIPLAMIERVDVSTGAAVTTYGADAIAGVVNFVTKRDFTGVDLQLSSGITEQGDGATFRSDLTVGGNFADGRGNAVLSLGYQTADPIYQGTREISQLGISTATGLAGGGSGTAVPARFTNTRGIDPATGLPSTNPATPNGGFRQITPDGNSFGPNNRFFNFNPYNIFQTPFKRFNIFAQANYEISDAVEVYSRGLFSKQNVKTIIAPSGLFSQTVDIPVSNPFMTPTMRNQFCARNTSTVASGLYTPLFTPAECAAAAVALSPTDPNYREFTTTVGRRTTEFGPRQSSYTTTVFDYTAGLRGPITDSISWDLSAAYGESNNTETATGYVITERVQEALLATNPNTCLSGNALCVPLNVFGPDGSISQGAAAFVSAPSTTSRDTSLLQVNGLISGDMGVTIPWATEGVAFALGGDYRKWTAAVNPDALSEAGLLGGGGGPTPRVAGAYSVQEVFGELILPVVQDKPFFENLTVEGGMRYSAYSVEAPGNPSYDAFTWKVGGNWEIGGGFKLRGNYAVAVRAPNIGELFTPETVGLTAVSSDPCAGPAPLTNPTLAAVCLVQGAQPGQLGFIENPTAGQGTSFGGGNPNLNPENATTWTVGAVFQPTFVPGLSLTFDYYNIKITDAITTPSSGDALNACFGNLTAASVTDPNCTNIRRNPGTGSFDGDSRGLPLPLSNLGTIFTDGIDITANYSHNLGFANLGVIWNFNYTFANQFQATPTSINRECVGYYSPNCGSLQPALNSNLRVTMGFDWVDVSVLWRYMSGFEAEPLWLAPTDEGGDGAQTAFPFIDSYNYIDLTGRFHVVENIDVILTINNLFNAQPPLVGGEAGSTAYNSGNTFPSTFDPLGRRYTMQVVFKF